MKLPLNQLNGVSRGRATVIRLESFVIESLTETGYSVECVFIRQPKFSLFSPFY
jgi:hypothetical protein